MLDVLVVHVRSRSAPVGEKGALQVQGDCWDLPMDDSETKMKEELEGMVGRVEMVEGCRGT